MYKISFCDENREKKNASAGSGSTKSLRGAVINQTGTHFYIYSAPKKCWIVFLFTFVILQI